MLDEVDPQAHAQRQVLALRVRLWIDFIKHSYGEAAYWSAASARARNAGD